MKAQPRQLTHGSLFAGIGGFDEGFHRSGFTCWWQVEKEPFCIAILKTRYPNAERYYDVLKCGHDRIHKLRPVDVVTAGFPCQDLSVAGKRAGLAGSRSGLFWEVVRILGELRPPWFVLENVPGLFSSNEGRDFAIVLNALDELGYGLAWRVLNSQFFGVAQRRRRVFIVGCFGKPCPAEVLFESEGGCWDIAQGGEARAELASEVAASLRASGEAGSRGHTFYAEAGLAVTLSSGTGVTGNAPGRRREDDINLAISIAENCRGELRTGRISPALSSGGGKPGSGYSAVAYHENLSGNVAESSVARAQRSGASHSYQFVATAIPASAGHHGHSSPRGDGSDNIIVQQAISSKWAKGSSGPAGDEHHNRTVCIQAARGQRDKRQNGIGIQEGGPMYTLDGTSQHAVGRTDDECAPPDSDGMRTFAGLPEGLDRARYGALGNAVTVSVAQWIGERIKAVIESE